MMNTKLLSVYLNDHLAGATSAIRMIQRVRNECNDPELRQFLDSLLEKIESDKKILTDLIQRFHANQSWAKRIMAWLLAALSGAKLSRAVAGIFGHFESLEMLSVGIQGKRALWRMLKELQSSDSRLTEIDFSRLIANAESQFSDVENWRIRCGKKAFLT